MSKVFEKESIEERLQYWYETVERCVDGDINIHGMRVSKDEEVIIRVKGRSIQEIRGRVLCYNPFWGTLLVETDELEVLVKVRDIVYIQKRKRK